MKCIINHNLGIVMRVSDDEAYQAVNKPWERVQGKWYYCPKHIWREYLRSTKGT